MSNEGDGAEETPFSGEQELRLLVEDIPALVWRAGRKGNIECVNKRLLDYIGATLDGIAGGGLLERVHRDDFPETAKAFHQAIQTGTSYQGVLRLRRADGEFLWHHVRCEPLRDRQGLIIQWHGLCVDIDEVKKAEERPGSVAQLQATLNVIPAYTWYTAPSGGLTFVNKRTADYLGLPKDHPLRLGIDVGATWDAHIPLLHPDEQEESRKAWSDCLRSGEAAEFSQRVPNAQGSYRWFLSRAEPLRASDGTLMQWVGVNLDIEELKRAEQALRESEYALRQIVETVPAQFWSLDPAGEPTQLNQRLLNYSGMRFEDFKHGGWKKFVHPDDFSETERAFRHAIQTGTSYQAVHRLRRADGEFRWHHVRGEPLRDQQGRIVQWYGLSVDIDEGKRAEDLLRRSEAFLAEAQRLSHTGASAYNATTILYWSEETYRIFGFDPRDGLPSREAVWDRIHPDDRARVRADVENAQNGIENFSSEFRIILPGGTVKYLESIRHPIFSTDGELVEVVATQIDVTERKRVEQALRESQAKFRDYAETASDWFWEIGPDYKFTLLTENAFGSDSADRIGTMFSDHALDLETESEKWRQVWEALDLRKPFRDFVYRGMSSNGSPMYVKASGKPVFDTNGEFRGYRGTSSDVTADMRAQEEHERLLRLESDLAHMNRLSVMGELTASLSHEITQPIATARNNARAALNFLGRQPPDLEEVREALYSIVGDADRAGDIIDRIRDQIKKAPPRKSRFDLNQAINEVILLARSAVSQNGISVQTRLAKGVLAIEGDHVQLQQVVLNLILNAVEAMSTVGTGPRELLISTEQAQIGGVLVSVRDSGPGIDPDRLDRIFEAFYTTKSSGLGMGLSICRSIIDAHGGRLWVDANEPRGAAFQFTLPDAEKELRNPLRAAQQT
ncbi:PAS domain-containing protein [Rhizobium indigoferae]|uniref:histidine kinase n=1 Tax=Rhizobium indigoferae TaxID=158891 RepID=A0ABZ1DT41_9HYPH|nr:PAS domain-containing protein [Rhizobium indigoferae]NNU55550.1 PAS domain-containing protein [Rhizobium indigoferae]WRW39400.1 PAS domain-containing protein [Rhizobium indigoferae]GLR56785.1 PAS domain-containing sensor histidine kinase [Rhizobium indigoferae]